MLKLTHNIFAFGLSLAILIFMLACAKNTDSTKFFVQSSNTVNRATHVRQGKLTLSQLPLGEWAYQLREEWQKPYLANLEVFLSREINQGKIILPSPNYYFAALKSTPLEKVKVVIIGQDPYPTPGNAHGLAFSVLKGVAIPGSLRNIFQEQRDDLGITQPDSGYLGEWAKQGVLLLNSVLTVEANKPNSHKGKGWEIFTDKIMDLLNKQNRPIVFLLWGSYAQKKGARLNNPGHLILKAAHPSPLSAKKGFFGCHHFSMTNQFLRSQNQEEIIWDLNKLPGQDW